MLCKVRWVLEDDVIELQGEELVESLRCQMEAEITLERQLSKEGLEVLMWKIDAREWRKAESKRSLGYNGLSKGLGDTKDKQRKKKKYKMKKCEIRK